MESGFLINLNPAWTCLSIFQICCRTLPSSVELQRQFAEMGATCMWQQSSVSIHINASVRTLQFCDRFYQMANASWKRVNRIFHCWSPWPLILSLNILVWGQKVMTMTHLFIWVLSRGLIGMNGHLLTFLSTMTFLLLNVHHKGAFYFLFSANFELI